MLEDALQRVAQFKGVSLTERIAQLEAQVRGASLENIRAQNARAGIDRSLMSAAASVKKASAQIDVVIHSAGILYSLPYILEPGETILSASLGAGNAGSDFDLVTSNRIAEFKFIYWQGGSGESVRKKSFFEDYFKLVRERTEKSRFFYLLNVEIPLRFLKGRSNSVRMLDKNAHLAADFKKLYGTRFSTVGEYHAANEGVVRFVDLVKLAPGLKEFIGLSDTEDAAA
ncbi:MAG: hypothetical protein SF051_06055 [Elusimicrobiota bacterium]|nr:hypothetical protein [Elusimicrobiota bacterium]